mmetsp:Transcript_23820/g.70690  ORF Transcript_23820/g.70690 Transcript_23820/m.70690 type:complete len:382 (+) Transcript_23820:484-1629(+)
MGNRLIVLEGNLDVLHCGVAEVAHNSAFNTLVGRKSLPARQPDMLRYLADHVAAAVHVHPTSSHLRLPRAQPNSSADLVVWHVVDGLHDTWQVIVNKRLALHCNCRARTNGRVDQFNLVCRTGDQGSTSVSNSSTALRTQRLALDLHVVHVKLPITLARNRGPSALSLEMSFINASQKQLAANICIWVPVQPEAEHWLINKCRINHLGEWWHRLLHGNIRKSKTKNSVKLCSNESQPWLVNGFCKTLVLYQDASKVKCVLTDIPVQASSTILDRKFSAIFLEGGRPAGVVSVVQAACDVEQSAVRARYPQVGATGVEDDLKLLWRRAKAYLAVVLRIEEIVQRDGSFLVGAGEHGGQVGTSGAHGRRRRQHAAPQRHAQGC